MRHFIVYHNPEKMGPMEPQDVELSIVTGKSVTGPDFSAIVFGS